ncbi:hypothetical protein TRICI_001279 [Trichomonascus ciferrii]|uniref:EKC/KEOPS complex subunit CGI121 n=1 Tax=Trichomonascus ciferrii TaxID=44093 RepID=A0A642VA37_9ASCO|nr:hypothetical protein TRICI_001279 [Trichomonascus ciferrii]
MITRKFPQFEDKEIQISLFTNVQNTPEIRSHMASGDPNYNYAFVNAATIVSLEHLLAATYRAINDHSTGKPRTRNLHSEIVFCLSPNNNIMDSLKRFGTSDESETFYAVKVVDEDEEDKDKYLRFLHQTIKGDELDVSEEIIKAYTIDAVVKKNYKINPSDVSTIISTISLRGY